MSVPSYVVRRRVFEQKAGNVPKSTYKPDTFPSPIPVDPVKVRPRIEELIARKTKKIETPPQEKIPEFYRDAPDAPGVDFAATTTCLRRDDHVLRRREEEELYNTATEPKDFLEWQTRMKLLSECKRRDQIQERRAALEDVRKSAMRRRKKLIEERMTVGRAMRSEFEEDVKAIQEEIEGSRRRIQKLKGRIVDGAPEAVARAVRCRIMEAREFKQEIRTELREAQRAKDSEAREVKEKAQRLREQAATHTLNQGDKWSPKVEITQTQFLAALTDDEANAIRDAHKEEDLMRIERMIEEHRIAKARKMDQLIRMLDRNTSMHAEREEEHQRVRKEKEEAESRRQKAQEAVEEEKLFELEARLDKKRQKRIKEAEEMEVHMRQIVARNRYLAVSGRALASKVFSSQQDGMVRMARERQESQETGGQTRARSMRKSEGNLKGLKTLLGL